MCNSVVVAVTLPWWQWWSCGQAADTGGRLSVQWLSLVVESTGFHEIHTIASIAADAVSNPILAFI